MQIDYLQPAQHQLKPILKRLRIEVNKLLRDITMSTARLLWPCAQRMVVALCSEPVMWHPSALQPPCPSSSSKSQYAAVGSTPKDQCRRETVTGCTGLHPSAHENDTLRQSTTQSPEVLHIQVKPYVSARRNQNSDSRINTSNL